MRSRAPWQTLPFAVTVFLAGCDAERLAAPDEAGEATVPATVSVQASLAGGLQCTGPDAASGQVDCVLDEGSAFWTAPSIIRTASVGTTFRLFGASGGAWGAKLGGTGGLTVATRAVSGGTSYELIVGGVGGDAGTGTAFGVGGVNGGADGGINTTTGFRAPGGGGGTEIRLGSTRVLVAGGGGGAGGAGGGTDGRPGSFDAGAGHGGSAHIGGAGGHRLIALCTDVDGQNGARGQGGRGASTSNERLIFTCIPGAGGGGGWFGGGGGAAFDLDIVLGGGGGSGFLAPEYNGFTSTTEHRGNGQITIRYFVPVAPPRVGLVVVDGVDPTMRWYNLSSSGSDGVQLNAAAFDPDLRFLRCDDHGGRVLQVQARNASFTLGDGAHSIECTASNGLVGAGPGSTVMPVLLNIDQTPPSLAPIINPDPIIIGSNATVTPNASDATSGVAAQDCDPVNATRLGQFELWCRASDRAGNYATRSLRYSVVFDFAGFFSIANTGLNQANAGRSIPVTFSLHGNYGLNVIDDGFPASQPVSCTTGASLGAVQPTDTPGSSSLSYAAGSDIYQYVWKTEKSWAGSCRRLIVRLIDGTEHIASFKFTK